MSKKDLKSFELRVNQIAENTLLEYKNEIDGVLKFESEILKCNGCKREKLVVNSQKML